MLFRTTRHFYRPYVLDCSCLPCREIHAAAGLHQSNSRIGHKGRNYFLPAGVVCVPSCLSRRAQASTDALFVRPRFQTLEGLRLSHPFGIGAPITMALRHSGPIACKCPFPRRRLRYCVRRVSPSTFCQALARYNREHWSPRSSICSATPAATFCHNTNGVLRLSNSVECSIPASRRTTQ